MRKFLLVAWALCLFGASAFAQETPKAEVSLDYSYIRNQTLKWNYHGGTASAAYNLNDWLGAVGEFGGYHVLTPSGNAFTYLFGPRLSLRKSDRFTPFAQALFGGEHFGLITPANYFAMTVGGGLDVNAGSHWAIRAGQVEYYLARPSGVNWNGVRVGGGIVFRFGSR